MKRDRGSIESFMDNNRAWIPMMIFSGIMSAIMFASMISFMGMTMNPVEAALTEDAAANSDVQDIAGTQSAAEDNSFASNGGGDMSTEDLSGFDSSGSGGDFGGDFEF